MIEFLDALLALIVEFIHRYGVVRPSSYSSCHSQRSLYEIASHVVSCRLQVVVLHGGRFRGLAAGQFFLEIGLDETVEFTIHDG